VQIRIGKKLIIRFWASDLQDCLEVEQIYSVLTTVVKSHVAFEPMSVLIRVSWSKVNEAAILEEGGILHLENITRYKTAH
jgi:hypothetical protein